MSNLEGIRCGPVSHDIFQTDWFGVLTENYGSPGNVRALPQETIARYDGVLPDLVLRFWREIGWCSWSRGK